MKEVLSGSYRRGEPARVKTTNKEDLKHSKFLDTLTTFFPLVMTIVPKDDTMILKGKLFFCLRYRTHVSSILILNPM